MRNNVRKLRKGLDISQEKLAEAIELPDGYELIMQVPNGVQRMFDESDGSKHAVMGYDFVVFYGYKMKI